MCNKDVGSFKVYNESYWQGEDEGRYWRQKKADEEDEWLLRYLGKKHSSPTTTEILFSTSLHRSAFLLICWLLWQGQLNSEVDAYISFASGGPQIRNAWVMVLVTL
jgi:hypothetical protein